MKTKLLLIDDNNEWKFSDELTEVTDDMIAYAIDNGNVYILGENWHETPRPIILQGPARIYWHTWRHEPRIKSAKIKRGKL